MLKVQNLNRTCVNDPLFSIETLSNSILRYHGLPGTSMGRNQDAFVSLYRIDRNFLECIEFELVFSIRFCWRDMFRDWNVVVILRDRYLMSNLIRDSFIQASSDFSRRHTWCLSSRRDSVSAAPVSPALVATSLFASVSKSSRTTGFGDDSLCFFNAET